jgi:hypothetical protein
MLNSRGFTILNRTKITKPLYNKSMSKITLNDVRKACISVSQDQKFGTYANIEKYIYNKYKLNKDPGIIALKIAYIDHTNSTNLRMDKSVTIAKLAEKIINIDFDHRVRKGDLTLVDEIANMGERKLLSFASKYCTYHNHNAYNRDDYCIYDSIVRKMLPKLLKNIGAKTTQTKLCDYSTYCNAIDALIEHYNLHELECPRRELDWYIWWNYRDQ